MTIELLKGKVLRKIEGAHPGSGLIVFETTDGAHYRMQHHQDCCENVSVEEVFGDSNDLIGDEILLAEEATADWADEKERLEQAVKKAAGMPHKTEDDSYTWTFYKLRTRKADVTIRWYGSSNGYYSERVDFERVS